MSNRISALIACAAGVLITATIVARGNGPATQPAGDHTGDHGKADKHHWGFTPYNRLSGLSEEQKMKINDIHRKFLADRKAIEDKQDADVTALLTDDQKAELEKMKADEKEKAAEHRQSRKDGDDKDKDKDK